jgi:acetate kinase
VRVIVINSGSSSIKYESFDVKKPECPALRSGDDRPQGLEPPSTPNQNGFFHRRSPVLPPTGVVGPPTDVVGPHGVLHVSDCSASAKGLLERIGTSDSRLKHRWLTPSGHWEEITETRAIADHREGFSLVLEVSFRARAGTTPEAVFGVGHRVVHGGERFKEPTIIDDRTLEEIRQLIPLAPLHNPANLTGIEVMRELLPDVPQVAVFDTAFHQTMQPKAFLYALPYAFYRSYGVRRYGFHGTSHGYVAREAARHLARPLATLNLITLHLGNGASATAIERGKSIDTSMGLTPLEGLIMGTRCGDLDPAIPFYLAGKTGRAFVEIEGVLNRESGLKGICGVNDMREIQSRALGRDEQAELALEMFCYRVKKYIGAYCAALGSVDAIVFTGGIGENSALVRSRSCDGLSGLGIALDERANQEVARGIQEIQAGDGRVKILVVPTDEEREIAQQTVETLTRVKGKDR